MARVVGGADAGGVAESVGETLERGGVGYIEVLRRSGGRVEGHAVG